MGKNTKHTAVSCTQKAWCRPIQFLCLPLQSQWAYVSPVQLIQWSMLSWCLLTPLIPTILCLSLFFPKLWGKYSMETSNVAFFLHNICLWLSAPTPIWFRRKCLWRWLDKAPIYKYKRISIGTISLIYFGEGQIKNIRHIWFCNL